MMDTAILASIASGATVIAGKMFLIAASSMPPPKDECTYCMRWFYDFVQLLASNVERTSTFMNATGLADKERPLCIKKESS